MLEAQTQKQSEELAGMNKKINELTSAKAMGDKVIEDLKKQLAAAQAQLKQTSNELVALTTSTDKTIADWEALCKKNAADIAIANKRIIELEAALANREVTAKKDASTIAALERQFLVHIAFSSSILLYSQPAFLSLFPLDARIPSYFIPYAYPSKLSPHIFTCN